MNELPRVKINLGNGNLSQTAQTADGVVGLVITGQTVAGTDKVTIGKSYQLFSLAQAEALGIAETGVNAFAYQQLKDFYAIAKTGAEIWIMLVASTVTLEGAADETNDFAAKLLQDAKGAIRTLAISKKSATGVTAGEGLDADVHTAVPKAQQLAETVTLRNRPIRVVLDGKDFTGVVADLKDYKEDTKNRVAIFIGNSDGSKNAAIGAFLGRKASVSVQRNLGRVKDGAIIDLQAYFTDGKPVEDYEPAWNAIHKKGYIFLRSFVGRAGYYLNDNPTLTANEDDYNDLPRGWVIDKAHILAYQTFVDEILDDIPVAEDGTISPALIKQWEAKIENVINQQMTANSEISAVQAIIDPNQNIISTGKIEVTVRVLPKAYAKYIDVNLGFTTEII